MKRILWGFIALLAGLILAAPASANNCLILDGVDDYINCTNDPSLRMTTRVTVEAWIWLSAANQSTGIVTKEMGGGGGYSLGMSGTQLLFLVGNGNVNQYVFSSSNLLPNTWYHVAGTYDGASIRVYINGQLNGTTGYTNGIVNSVDSLSIGRCFVPGDPPGKCAVPGDPPILLGPGGYAYFAGKIDLVRVWNIARTQRQLDSNKTLAVVSGAIGLVAQYTFDQGAGGGDNTLITTLIDNSGTSKNIALNGALSGFTLTGILSNWVGSNSPAAVEMSSFTATGQSGRVQLAWSTASETNSFQWLVERSMAAENGFARIGTLQAASSSCGHAYTFTDNAVQPDQTYYYRIIEQDINGKLTYYGPVQASAGITAPAAGKTISAWPNPFRAGVRLQLAAQSRVQVYDLTGRLVRNLGASTGEIAWDGLNDSGLRLGPGVYFVRADGPGGMTTRKVTKIQ